MDIDAVCRRLGQAKAARSNWDNIFQQIADRVLPLAADFQTKRENGAQRTELMFDATASLALSKSAAALESFATPRNMEWHKLRISSGGNPELAKSQRVKVWMDEANKRLFGSRYSPKAAFSAQSGEAYLHFMAFGTAPMMIDEDLKRRALRYKALPLASTWVLEDGGGMVDTLFREKIYTLRQILALWPETFPEKYSDRLKVNPDYELTVTQVIAPSEDYDPGAPDRRGKPWYTCYFIADDKHKLEESGYWSWPVPTARYATAAGEVYGRSPAWLALPNIKVLNEQKKTILKAGHRAATPPLLATEDGILSAFSVQPDAINYGGLDSQGREMIKPLNTAANVGIGMDMMEAERAVINEGFLIDLFRVLAENPQMTATQTMELVQERAALMAPVLGRLQSEWHGPMIERELDLLMRAGQLPEMPPELLEANGEYEIEYTSPMARAARASEGIAIMRTMESVISLAQFDKSAMFKFKIPEIAQELAEINGMPAKLMNDEDEVNELMETAGEQAETQQLLQAAPQVASTAANLVKMQQNYGRPMQ